MLVFCWHLILVIYYPFVVKISGFSMNCMYCIGFRATNVGFMVDKVALGQVFLRVLWIFSVINPLMLHSPVYDLGLIN
jgi:hypothetical protein